MTSVSPAKRHFLFAFRSANHSLPGLQTGKQFLYRFRPVRMRFLKGKRHACHGPFPILRDENRVVAETVFCDKNPAGFPAGFSLNRYCFRLIFNIIKRKSD